MDDKTARFRAAFDSARFLVEDRLSGLFSDQGLEAAMRYSLLAGGKRIRPVLTLKFCEAAGGDMRNALDYACGIELLHTYSLIHDDLPCMDNDDLRRGKPTCHKTFGECTATLAGDALQAAAFRLVLQNAACSDASRALAGRILAEAAGEQGMCGGQYLDTIGDGQTHTAEELTAINDLKTGALLRAACMMGVAAALDSGHAAQRCFDAAGDFATNLGLAFQIRDDILDEISTAEVLGKNTGSDAANEKTTYVTLLGAEECERRVLAYTQRAKEALDAGNWQGSTEFLRALADSLALREK